MRTIQETASPSTLTGMPRARAEWPRKTIGLGLVLALSLALTVAAVGIGYMLPGTFWTWGIPWQRAAGAVDFVPRCSAVASGVLTVLAIRRQWVGVLAAMLMCLLHGYTFVAAHSLLDELFWSHNRDIWIHESLYVALFALGAHPVMRLVRLGYPAAIDLEQPAARPGRRFGLADLLLATALAAGYLGTINLIDLLVDLEDEPFTPHLGIALSVFFMASVISPILWVLLQERTLTAHWLWIVPWCILFPITGQLALNALVFWGGNPYYWVENRVVEIIACVGIAVIDALALRAMGFRWRSS